MWHATKFITSTRQKLRLGKVVISTIASWFDIFVKCLRWRNTRPCERYQVGQDLRSHDISLSSTLSTSSSSRWRKIARWWKSSKGRCGVLYYRATMAIQMSIDRFRSVIKIARRYFATLRKSRSVVIDIYNISLHGRPIIASLALIL